MRGGQHQLVSSAPLGKLVAIANISECGIELSKTTSENIGDPVSQGPLTPISSAVSKGLGQGVKNQRNVTANQRESGTTRNRRNFDITGKYRLDAKVT